MRIDNPKVANLEFQDGAAVADSQFTGSFTGSFTGVGNFTGLTADSVEYDSVLNKPTLISSSAQVTITESQISDLGTYTATDSAQALGAAANVLTLSSNTLTLTRGDGSTDTVDLSAYLDEDSRSIDSGVLNAGTGIVTYTRDDNSTFTLDLSALLDDTNLVTSVNGAAGVVVLDTGDISEDGNLYYTDTRVKTKLTADQVVSGSDSQVRTFLNVEDGADVTDTTNVVAALTAGTNVAIAADGTISSTDNDTTYSVGDGGLTQNNFTNALKSKLDDIEADADVTDATNVTAAGALMDSEVTNLADVKAFDTADYATAAQGTTADSAQQPPSEGAFVDGDKTKLDNIEENADVTDATNVTAAGALMDTEVTNLADVKAFDPSDYATAAQGTTADSAQQPPSEGAFVNGDKTKLDNIEDNADVTDAANVASSLVAATSISSGNKTTIQSNLGVDVAGTDNSTNVTLGGTPDYITISGQVITRNKINLGTDVVGTLAVGNMSATALTTVQTAANETAHLALTDVQEGDVVVRSDENKTYMHNGGTAGTMADFTLLATPTDSVTSVNGNTGAVTVTENVTTNLGITGTTGARTITSSDGNNATIPVATDSVSGVMSATDHAKLTNIEANATADQTAAEIRTAVGTGNNGVIPSAGTAGHFLKHDGTFGLPSYTTNTDTNDDVSIANLKTRLAGGFASNAVQIGDLIDDVVTVNSLSANDITVDSITASALCDFEDGVNIDLGLGVGTANPGVAGEIRATGDITAYYSSDERLKENFAPLTGALDKVKAIGGYEFDWKDGIEDVVSKKGHDIGVKAQELQAQYPELVHERDNGYLAVDYIKLNAVLIEAVKELAAKVEELSK